MSYEWDNTKCESNLMNHGVDFADMYDFDWNASKTIVDTRGNYCEERFISIAPIRNRLHVLVWTPRKNNIRVISLRKANSLEVSNYG